MGNKAQKKSEQSNWDHQKALIYNALAQLTPENIQQLTQVFLPHIQSAQAMQAQTALHGLMRNQARSGLAGSRIGASQILGLQANQGNNALQQAFAQAMGLAGQRASVWTGQPLQQNPPNYNLANAFQQGSQQALLAYALSGKGGNQTPTPSALGTYNWGLPPGTPPTYGYNPQAPL